MGSTTLRFVFALLGGAAIGACDREPVVAGVFHYEAPATAGAPTENAGAGGVSGDPALDCSFAPWYVDAVYITTQLDCQVPIEQAYKVSAVLRAIPPPIYPPESHAWSVCVFKPLIGVAQMGKQYVQVCQDWCDHIAAEIRKENLRTMKCDEMQSAMDSP